MATRKTLNKQLSEGKITQELFDKSMKQLKAASASRRATKRKVWKAAALEIIEHLKGPKYDTLSEDAKHLLELLSGDPRAVVTVRCQKGDKLMDLLSKYQDVKDCYGKLARYCEKNGLEIDMATATIVEVEAKPSVQEAKPATAAAPKAKKESK